MVPGARPIDAADRLAVEPDNARWVAPPLAAEAEAGPGSEPVQPPLPPREEPIAAEGLSVELLVERAGEAIVASDASHRIVVWNPAAELLFGWSARDAIGRLDHEVLVARTDAGQTAEIVAGLVGRRPWSAELTIRRRDGLPVPVRLTASALWSRDGSVAGYVAVITDLRDVRSRAAAVEAAAAMDAVARLARAVARELSDGMTRVDAAVRTALARLPTADPVRGLLDDALRSVDAAAAMAAQLRAVGRDRPLVPAVVHLADVIERSLPALKLLAGPGIEIELDLDPGAPPVCIDPSVASQLVLHLAASSCGAMHDRGRLDIAVRVHDIGSRVARSAELVPGSYVVLEVRDTREALPESFEKVFEPNAEPGVPHALGLAAAHGLVTSTGGRILAEPASGGGLVFRVYLQPAT
jgi:PAS domain S-box-containing protein